METMTLKIDGMTCGHCVGSVNRALGQLAGVRVDQVKVGSAVVSFDPATVSTDQIADAIADAGYAVADTQTA